MFSDYYAVIVFHIPAKEGLEKTAGLGKTSFPLTIHHLILPERKLHLMLTQQYELYTAVDQHTWRLLFERQYSAVQHVAYSGFAKALQTLHFSKDRIPDFNEINETLKGITGWQLYAVPGLIENRYFFEQMLDKKFGATTWLRKPEQIDYLEEPDMFHDVFGHVPLLADTYICDYLHSLARIAKACNYSPEAVEAIARLYWYTIEFGLIRENGELKIYGAGVLSSIGETEYALGTQPAHLPFDTETITRTPYIKDDYQQQYFVLSGREQLVEAAGELERLLK